MTPDYEAEAQEYSDMAPEPTLLANLVTDDCCICGEDDARYPVVFDPGTGKQDAMAHFECYENQREGWEEFKSVLAWIGRRP